MLSGESPGLGHVEHRTADNLHARDRGSEPLSGLVFIG